MQQVTGKIYDKQTNAGIPGATVQFISYDIDTGDEWNENAIAANGQGNFSATTNGNAIEVTSAEYKSAFLFIDENGSMNIGLERNVKQEGDVVIHPTKKKTNAAWLLLLLLPMFIKPDKKKKRR